MRRREPVEGQEHARLGLAPHIYLCRDEDSIVLLDLRHDRYFSLEAAGTAALTTLLPGWPAAAADERCDADAARRVAAVLLRRGWLLEGHAAVKDATPARSSELRAELLKGVEEGAGAVTPTTLASCLIAGAVAGAMLRCWRLERIVRRIAARKAGAAPVDGAFDLERARRLVATYARLRIFLFSQRRRCLRDSLALLEFLAWHGVYPDWVFGVRARPFAAHCWVQHDGIVFNDTLEHSRSFKTIMVI